MNCVLNSTGSLPPTFEEAVAQLKAAERSRLMKSAGLIEKPVEHFHRPPEQPFTVEERDRVTILFGGFTWKHERFIEAILKGSGYRCQMLPTPDVAAFTIGKEYGNNGQCNPTYFTIGNLIKYLQSLESQGLSRRQIVDRYIFFTAGSCGPCRFGMYESEYRLALDNAGFEDFRILLYQADQAIKTASDNPGLNFTLDFNLGALNMLNLGDVINDMVYQIRPYEVVPGATDQAIEEIVSQLSSFLETRERYEILERTPGWISRYLARNKKLTGISQHSGQDHRSSLQQGIRKQNAFGARAFEHDRSGPHSREAHGQDRRANSGRNLPKATATSKCSPFLKRKARRYGLNQSADGSPISFISPAPDRKTKRGIDVPYPDARWWEVKKKLSNDWKFRKKWLLLRLSEGIWTYLYARTARHMGGLTPRLVPQTSWPGWRIPFITRWPAAAKGISKWLRTFTTHARTVPHGAGAEAVRLYAVFAIRWRAVGRGQPFSGDDFSAD